MKEPKAAHKTQRDEHGVEGALGAQTKLLQVLVGICVAIVIVFAAVGYGLYHEITLLDRKVSALQRSTQAGIERATTLTSGNSTGLVTLLKAHGNLEQQLARIESAVAPKPETAPGPITDLTANETAGLRALFKLTRNANASPQYKVGDKIASDQLKPVPENVTRIVPRLKGMNFLIDRNGTLVVTTGADNAIVLIVEPT